MGVKFPITNCDVTSSKSPPRHTTPTHGPPRALYHTSSACPKDCTLVPETAQCDGSGPAAPGSAQRHLCCPSCRELPDLLSLYRGTIDMTVRLWGLGPWTLKSAA